MRFGSVCSGIEAASVAWNPLGWKAAWISEIEPFPCDLLAHHYPDTPNFGDMTKFKDWPDDESTAIDLLCGGTPCQSFSVAGLRKGLDDPRGDLMLTFASIAAKYRPRWLVWENVPGVLSSNGGRDFAAFLGLLSGQKITPPADGWQNSGVIQGYRNAYSLSWRVLDAEYFGVAQRRHRVFVVGHLGDWRAPAAVLLERHSVSGDSAPKRGAGEAVASTITASAYAGGACGRPEGAAGNHFVPLVLDRAAFNQGENAQFETYIAETETMPTLVARGPHAVMCMASGQGGAEIGIDFAPTLTCNHEAPIAIAGNIIGRKPENGGNGTGVDESGVMFTLTKTDRHAVAFSPQATASQGVRLSDVSPTLDTCKIPGVMTAYMVRRLTPKEFERLQGFPDDYTLIPRKGGRMAADSPRYKAIGNSWAVPVARWIGERIMAVEDAL